MRRILALALTAAACAVAAPPATAETCVGSRAGVCFELVRCLGGATPPCQVTNPAYVDPYCEPRHPAIAACFTIENLYVPIPPPAG